MLIWFQERSRVILKGIQQLPGILDMEH